ncbi:MAG: response regulator [Salibacteraceae bacterium]
MRRLLLTACSLLCFAISAIAQLYKYEQIAPLKASLNEASAQARIHLFLKLADGYLNFQIDSALVYAQRAQQDAEALGYAWGIQKGKYQEAKALAHTTASSTIAQRQLSCEAWFKKNDFEHDAWLCRIEYLKSITNSRPLKVVAQEASNILDAVNPSESPYICGTAWYCLYEAQRSHEYNKTNFRESLDTALTLFKQAHDSTAITWVELKKIEHSDLKQNQQRLREVLLQVSNWQNKLLMSENLNLLMLTYSYLNQQDATHLIWPKNQHILDEYGSKKAEAMYHYWMGESLSYLNEKKQAIPHTKKAIALYDKLEDNVLLYKSLKSLADFNEYFRSLVEALNLYWHALEIANELENPIFINFTKKSLALIHLRTKEYEKAEKLTLEVLNYFQESFTGKLKSKFCGFQYEILGRIYRTQHRYHEAHAVYNKAHSIYSKVSLPGKIRIDWQKIALFLDQSQVDSATAVYAEVQKETRPYRKNDFFDMVEGKLFFAQKKYSEAANSIQKYLNSGQSTEYSRNNSVAQEYLYKIAKAQGRFSEALEYLEIHKSIEDSLQRVNEVENILLIESRYEIEQKEADLLRLEQEKQLQSLTLQSKEDELSIGRLYIFILLLSLFLFGGVIFWRARQGKLKKEKEAIRHAKERVELAQARATANQKIELSRLKDELFANVSHELRTPLTLILVPLKNLLKSANKKELPVYESILKSGDQLLDLVDKILELSRLESGATQLRKSSMDVTAFGQQLEASFLPLFDSKNIVFRVALPDEKLRLKGDANRLKMVLNNLLNNAFHHCPENGEVHLQMTSKTTENGHKLEIRVRNTGNAIPEALQERIFDRFFRQEEQAYTGSGIGLALSRQIVAMHNGTIRVANAAIEGVEFQLLLPDVELVSPAPKPEATPIALPSDEAKKHSIEVVAKPLPEKPTVLVVEDNLEMQDLLKDLLANDFYIRLAANGIQGEEMAIEHQPQLILSDVMMPERDGIELLQVIKSNIHTSHIPVVLLTARADNESRIIGFNEDADDYISKPFDPDALRSRIHNLLRQRQQLQKRFTQKPTLLPKTAPCTTLAQEFMSRAQKIVETHYTDGQFSVELFSQELALNRNSVHNKLKALTGQSAWQYIQTYRLSKAAELLHNTTDSINLIATETGFNNRQAFNKRFRSHFEMTPGEYRKKPPA